MYIYITVPPVLDATRSMVIKFNRILRENVENNDGLLWLDFEDKLTTLTVNGKFALTKELELDGTHMHPSYLPYLSEAMIEKL